MRILLVFLVACASTPSTPSTITPTPQAEAAYAEACGMREHDQIAVSPIARHGLGARTTTTGVVVELDAKAGAPVIVLADLRCHRAWMMRDPANEMPACALGLPGLRIDVEGDAWSSRVVLSVADPQLVPELQRRVAAELAHP